MKRTHLFNICRVDHEKPIISIYGFKDNSGKIIATKSYYKSWYKKILKHQKNRYEETS